MTIIQENILVYEMLNGSTLIVANKTSKGKYLVKLTMCFIVLTDNYKWIKCIFLFLLSRQLLEVSYIYVFIKRQQLDILNLPVLSTFRV